MLDGNMGTSGFNKNACMAFKNKLKQAVRPFVEKITGLYRMVKIAHYPACQWAACKPYMPGGGIPNYLTTWGIQLRLV